MFFIVVLLVAVLGCASFWGVSNTYGDLTRVYIKGAKDLRLGLDLRGGVEAVYGPPEGVDATEAELRSAESILKRRLLSQGITDGEVYTDLTSKRILVRYPEDTASMEGEELQAAVAELGETAQLTLREGSERDENNRPSGVTKDNVILTSKDVLGASVQPSQRDVGQYVVLLDLTEEGAAKFSEASDRLSGTDTSISIWLDDTMIAAPSADNRTLGGKPAITGQYTEEGAARLADKINLGPLPFRMQVFSCGPVSPVLGAGASGVLVKAAVVAFCLCVCFLIARYRLCGAVAGIALFGQLSLLLAAATGFVPMFPAVSFPLAGVAAMFLSLWLGMDANINAAERIREELDEGKNLDAAVDQGFRRAQFSLWDSSLLTMAAAALLLFAFAPGGSWLSPFLGWMGRSTSVGMASFGYLLVAGAAANLLMNGAASRLMLKSLCRMKTLRDPFLFGGGPR